MSLTLGLVVVLLGPAFSSRDAVGPDGPASPAIARLAGDKALKDLDLGASVRCTVDDAVWGAHRGAVPMSPASGAKLLTTAAALAVLGPDFTTATRVHARVDGGVGKDVALVAGADPSLTLDDLDRLAQAVKASGVTRIEGGVAFDLGVFAGSPTPPAFDTKNTDAGYRPEVPSFAVVSGTLSATVTAGKAVGAPVRVTTSLLAPSILLENDATTAAGKAIDKLVIEARAGKDGATRLIVSGSLGKEAPPQGVKKRLADPARTAAELFVAALRRAGVDVDGGVRFAAMTDGVAEIARLTSDPLAADVRETNTTSNNFMAETIFKHLGRARPDAGATWEQAAERVAAALSELGLAKDRFTIVNGSGLYLGTKVAADAMTELLTVESHPSAAADAFRASLAVAGKTGTLKGRLKKLAGKVSGKTGTLDNALSLSGYVPAKGCLLAFSVMVNGDIGDRAGAVNRRIDAFVLELAGL